MLRYLSILFLLLLTVSAVAQEKSMSEKMARTVMMLWPDSMAFKNKTANWSYEQGFILKGIENIWKRTGDGRYFDYIQKNVDFFVRDNGTIRNYESAEYNIDQLMPGRSLMLLYNVTEEKKYLKAAQLLRQQLKTHPRTTESGFLHKASYPWQIWLEDLYMSEPFYAEYAAKFEEQASLNDIENQFVRMEQHVRDPKTGLLYHGWDESKDQKWANKNTGCSPNFCGRAMGWYGMALVDVLDYFPVNLTQRKDLIEILERYAQAIIKVQDTQTGLWYQILDQACKQGNYTEASASCMFVYTLAKAVRMEYLDEKYLAFAKKGYDGILKNFISTDQKGYVHLT